MTLKQLEQFLMVADGDSISAVAERLYVSQPALTNAIQRLEKELGIELFDRINKQVVLNENGRIVRSYCVRLFDLLSEMEHTLQGRRQRRQFRLASDHPVVNALLTSANMSGDFDVRAVPPGAPTTFVQRLQGGECDVILTNRPVFSSFIRTEMLSEDSFLVNLPATDPLAASEALYACALSGHTVPNTRAGNESFAHHVLDRYFKGNNIQLRALTIEDTSTLDYHLRSSSHCCFISRVFSKYCPLEIPGRVNVPLADPALVVPYYISYLPEKDQMLRPLLEWIKTVLE